VSCSSYTEALLSTSTRSGWRESPLLKMEMERWGGLRTMNYLIQMRGLLQFVVTLNYDARYILKIGFATWINMLESLGLETEWESRCSGERQFSEIFLNCEGIFAILDDKIKDFLRYVMMNLSPKTASMLITMKKYRWDNEAMWFQFVVKAVFTAILNSG